MDFFSWINFSLQRAVSNSKISVKIKNNLSGKKANEHKKSLNS